MISLPLALTLLAIAIPLWSSAGMPKVRLLAIAGRPPASPHWLPRLSTNRLLPAIFAISVGALLGLVAGWPIGLAACVVGWLGIRRFLRRRNPAADPLGTAAVWDLLAACLRAGLPVPTAVLAIAADLPPDAAGALRATADLLTLGADPVAAWAPALDCATTAELARGARRTARSGTALAGVATGIAASIRDTAGDAAEAKAQRAGVLITGPLGLCFLPAFVCLGIVPVVVGLAGQLTVHP
jgi:Flp pilus assembly protein TadB